MAFTDDEGKVVYEPEDKEAFAEALAKLGHKMSDSDFEAWTDELGSGKPEYDSIFSENPKQNAKIVGHMAKMVTDHDIGMNNDVKGLRDFVAKERGWTRAQANVWVRKSLSRKEE